MIFFIFIWGSIIYKFFGNQNVYDENLIKVKSVKNYKHNYFIVKDTFELKLIARDPFGSSKHIVRSEVIKKHTPQSNIKKINSVTKKNTIWPNIVYHGFVKNERNLTRLILLNVNNRLYRKREKDNIDELILLKAYNDSLIVTINNERKTIMKLKK